MKTEALHPSSRRLDALTSLQIVRLMSRADAEAVRAVRRRLGAVARLADKLARSLKLGGRIFLVGAGTSGRLAAAEAAECPPTFGVPPRWVQAIVAGGTRALRRSVEGAEDDERAGARELRRRRLGRKDWVIGVSASGRTPFVIGALAYARSAGTGSTLITCNPKRGALYLPTGPEVVSGSTRLKAGTATKLVLNMLTTAAMVRLQRVFAGYMVDLRMNNRKLRRRAVRIVRKLAGVGAARARRAILQARGNPKTAVAMLAGGLDYRRARAKLRRSSLQDLVRR